MDSRTLVAEHGLLDPRAFRDEPKQLRFRRYRNLPGEEPDID
jgi:hypothetical protein